MGNTHNIRIFHTAEHACGYWPERVARDIILDPSDPTLPLLYGHSLGMGFRRSGGHVYRPNCANCRACVAVRIPVDEFAANRSQKRCMARNAELTTTVEPARRSHEIFSLYRRYLDSRHAGGGMDGPKPEDFDAFLACAWSPTEFLVTRLGSELVSVAVTDVHPLSLSAVYTFFSPRHRERSLGTFAILSQIELAKRLGREHLYLGFWIDTHPKMSYKRNFQPLEYLDGREWKRFDTMPTASSA